MGTSCLSKFWDSLKSIFNPNSWHDLGQFIDADTLLMLLIGIFAIYIVARLILRQERRVLKVYSYDKGLVYLRKSALKNLIKRVCKSVVAPSNARVKICARCRKIYIKITISCPYNVQPITVNLQQTVDRMLKDKVGLTNVGRIDVVVNHIFGPVKTDETFTVAPQPVAKPVETAPIVTAPDEQDTFTPDEQFEKDEEDDERAY